MAGLTDILTGGLIDSSAPNYASVAGKNEKKRQGIIKLGLGQINSVFSGGTSPFYGAANTGENKFDRSQTYYGLNGKGQFAPYWAPGGAHPKGTFEASQLGKLADSPIATGDLGISLALSASPFSLSKIFGKSQSPRDIARKQFNRGQLFTAPNTQTFEGFQPSFYDKRSQDYVNFALPQLAQQYQTNRNAMLFGLENRGLGNSSVANAASSNLERSAGQGRQEIADTGLAQANQLRKDVEGARQQAISQLYQSADPAQALQGAVRNAIGFQAPSTFAPVANMFTGLAQQYATDRLLNNYRQAYAAPGYAQNNNYLAPIPNP